ncbi:MAG TPA: site-specific DNA-methyltransferase, partial [Candidatus Latescibacteria bacterium]|nr:site-specific DNA-methyltransferase [Candidatus Latescibacterota bacterium]
MARKKSPGSRSIESYDHADKQRANNPPVGLVTPETDPDAGKKRTYQYDPHLDPQLVWAGKAEHTSFEVPTVSLHVHERIDPRTIIEAVKKRNGNAPQTSLFDVERAEPLRDAIEFYKHAHGWSNRLVAGDSLLVMNSLLEKEGMAGKVQMIYVDPPYGIKYGSNFQPFVNKRDVKDGKDDDLTAEPEQIRAFRDTWELGIHSYLTYLRDRLLLARELLTESGSIFVQISDENVHHVKELMDEVLGAGSFCGMITFRKTVGQTSELLAGVADYLLWYSRDRSTVKFRRPMRERRLYEIENAYRLREKPDGTLAAPDDGGGDPVQPLSPTSQTGSENTRFGFEISGCVHYPPGSRGWSTNREGMSRLETAGRLSVVGGTLVYKRYLKDAGSVALSLLWDDTMQSTFSTENIFVVQTYSKVIQRCLLMTTDPGDLVFDPTCGSGTTAYVAERWGRRWITCDTSRVALTLAKQRLMTAVYDYYELAHPHEGVGSGFRYKTVPHVTLKSIANNPEIREGMTREQIDAAIARHAEQET